MIDGFPLRAFEDWVFDEERISKPFPFTEPWIWEGEESGKMWFFTDVGIQPANPSMNYREWMEYWLNGGEDFFYGYQYDGKS